MSPNVRPLHPELQKIAEAELNEVPSRITEDLRTFREWIAKQEHIRGRTDDQHLLAFLRGTKYSLERAKQKYDLYYTVRSSVPEVFSDRDPKSEKNLALIRKGLILPLVNTAKPEAPRVFIVRKAAYEPEKYSIYDALKIVIMMNDICMQTDDNFVVAGQESLVDLAGTSFGHLTQMSPKFAKTATMISQDAAPVRNKGSHYVNTPTGFQTIYNLFKTFLSEKSKQRVSGDGVMAENGRVLFTETLNFQIRVHGADVEKVLEYIPKELLPEEYGGSGGTIQELIDHWERKFMEHRDFLIESEKYGVDESKRKTEINNQANGETKDLGGVEGSFRKINVE